jgi:hypothetical protein
MTKVYFTLLTLPNSFLVVLILANPVTHTRTYSLPYSGSDTGTNTGSDPASKFSFTSMCSCINMCFSPYYDSTSSSIEYPSINSTSYAGSKTSANTTSKSPLVSNVSSRKRIFRCLPCQIISWFFYILANPVTHTRTYSLPYSGYNTGTNDSSANTTSKSPVVSTVSSRKSISDCLHCQILSLFFFILANAVTHTRTYSLSNSASDTGTVARYDSASKSAVVSTVSSRKRISRCLHCQNLSNFLYFSQPCHPHPYLLHFRLHLLCWLQHRQHHQ